MIGLWLPSTGGAGGEAIADERDLRDLIEVKAFVLVAPEQPGQPLRTELLAVLIPVDS